MAKTQVPNKNDVLNSPENARPLEAFFRVNRFTSNHDPKFPLGSLVHYNDYPESLYVVKGIATNQENNGYIYTLTFDPNASDRVKAKESELSIFDKEIASKLGFNTNY